jgi:phenylacetate-CoA ligase
VAENFPKRLVIATNHMEQLRALLVAIIPANAFYARKFEAAGIGRKISSLGQFSAEVPFTLKRELVEDQHEHPPYGTNLTYPLDQYVRYHQTSGTSGAPLRWLDNAASWSWMAGNWEYILRTAGVTRTDRIFCAFSFGPFIGFWLAFEAASRLGCLCLPGGGLSSAARLRLLIENEVTVLCCTPTYGIHLAEVAARENIDLRASKVKTLIVAGEPGGSIPSTRQRLKKLWNNARVFDHHGMTETGPVSYECPARPGVLHVLESEYIAEIVDPASSRAVPPGQTGELVLTTLGRTASPVLRYRTGDLVKASLDTVCECGRSDLALEGGIIGRTDDMVIIRGVNIYPTAVEEIIRGFGEIAEYQVNISTSNALHEISIQIEAVAGANADSLAQALQKKFETAWSLRVPVAAVAPGTLPRYELKARRWIVSSSK